jgi:hypothetical protein
MRLQDLLSIQAGNAPWKVGKWSIKRLHGWPLTGKCDPASRSVWPAIAA